MGYLVRIGVDPIPTCSPVQLGGPFDFCAFALLSDCGHSRPRAWLSGNRFEAYSSSSAFLVFDWRDCMTEGGGCQEEPYNNPSMRKISALNIVASTPRIMVTRGLSLNSPLIALCKNEPTVAVSLLFTDKPVGDLKNRY